MNRLDRYLFIQLFLSVAFSCLAITIVVWFSQSIRLLSLVINNGGTLFSFFKLMVLILPTFLPLILPLSLMVGALFVYQRLIMDSELVVMQALGKSPLSLTKPALMMGAVVALAGYILTVFVAPVANHELVRLQYQIRSDHSVLLLRTGAFNDVRDGLTFFARSRGKEGEMQGIIIHDTRKKEKPVTIMAESGELVRGEQGPQVLVKKGLRQSIDKDTGVLSQLSFDSYLLDLSNMGDDFAGRWREPRERTMTELLTPTGMDTNPVVVNRFLAEFHMRLTLPFLAITFVLISCSFLLTGHFDRRGVGRKVIMAAVCVVLLEATMLSAMNMISKQVWMIGALYLIAIVPLPFLFHRLATAGLAGAKPAQQGA